MTKLKREFKTLFNFGEADTEEEQIEEVTADVAFGDMTGNAGRGSGRTARQAGPHALPTTRTPVPGGAAAARPASQGTECTSKRLTWRRNFT